ncbi:MAG: DUF4384 domain-containing protein [Alphaproteobacteria bacterium]
MAWGIPLAAALCLLSGLASTASAAWLSGRGERLFGPETAEADACRVALEQAKEDALRQIAGERLSSEDVMSCADTGDAAAALACHLHRYTWSEIDGDVRGVRNVFQDVHRNRDGDRACTVTLEADVAQNEARPDPSFDLVANLNHTLFRHGEPMEIALNPTQPMHVAVFTWAPYDPGRYPVRRVFPNDFDNDSKITSPVTIPSPEKGRSYSLLAEFPAEGAGERRQVDEFLLAVATREPVTFKDRFALEEFKSRLHELPATGRRIVKHGYTIARPE